MCFITKLKHMEVDEKVFTWTYMCNVFLIFLCRSITRFSITPKTSSDKFSSFVGGIEGHLSYIVRCTRWKKKNNNLVIKHISVQRTCAHVMIPNMVPPITYLWILDRYSFE